MRKTIYIIIAIFLLYLIPSYLLHLVYGDSYQFLQSEDCWIPDGSGGWLEHGNPADPMPTGESVNIPVLYRYIPIFIPALLLIILYLSPLAKKIESKDEIGIADKQDPNDNNSEM